MVLDFSWLPPEINSALIFGGAGSGSLLVAAQAWDALAQDLQASAASFGSVLTQLATGAWSGPAAEAMGAAAAPYVSWLNAAAEQAGVAASQAVASATAFETAQSATVHPAAVTANRVTLASLISTNFLGQNAPAIGATEFAYMEMWAQDVAAMVGYHTGATSALSSLGSFGIPPVNLSGLGNLVSSAASQVSSAVSSAGSSLSAGVSSLASGVPSLMSTVESLPLQDVSSLMYPLSMAMYPMSMMMGFMRMGGMGGMGGMAGAAGAGLPAAAPKFVGATAPAAHALGGGGLGSMSAGLGKSRLVGAVSVPPTWQGSTPSRMATNAMSGLGGSRVPNAAAMADAAAARPGGIPMMPMPMGMGGAGAGMPGGPLGRGGASPHVAQSRPTVVPRIGI